MEFTPGLNIVLAEKLQESSAKDSRNGAGKSSIIEIIHFLLGSTASRDSIFSNKALVSEDFGMQFDVDDKLIDVTRSGVRPNILRIDELPKPQKQITPQEWTDELGLKIFGISPENTSAPSFRTLISYFVRRQSSHGFEEPTKHHNKQSNTDSQLAVMYLLGFDWEVITELHSLQEKEKAIKNYSQLNKQLGIQKFSANKPELRTQIAIEEDKFWKLKKELDNFRVLEQYESYVQEANQLTEQMNRLTNENFIDGQMVNNLRSSLASESPPDFYKLESIYKELNIQLPELIRKRYQEVEKFHESVLSNRLHYLSSEIDRLENSINERTISLRQLDNQKSQIIEIINQRGALEQFNLLQTKLNQLEFSVSEKRNQINIIDEIDKASGDLKISKQRLKQRLDSIFSEQKDFYDETVVTFEKISQRLYDNAGSMSIEASEAGPRFKFHISGARSKGINNMQLFCFDLMLIQIATKRGRSPKFLIHDSHLFDGVDGRQVQSALSIGAELAKESGFQYIVTMNEDEFNKERIPYFDPQIFVNPTRLSDSKEDGGLFGIRFD